MVRSLQAGGATEMRQGLFAALVPLRSNAQRQVVLITDGQIGFETELVQTILEKLPAGSRLNVVGVGSSVNRSLTHPAARAGRGMEVIVGNDEDAERVTKTLLARTVAPLVTELSVTGSALVEKPSERLPDLFAGAPVLLALKLDPNGGELEVRGATSNGPWSAKVKVPAVYPGDGSPAVASLFGRERVEDLEMRIAAGQDARALEADIERTGLDFQIATRLTSWVAVSEEVDVDPRKPTRRVKMPHQLPQGVSAEGVGLRRLAPAAAPAPSPAPVREMAVLYQQAIIRDDDSKPHRLYQSAAPSRLAKDEPSKRKASKESADRAPGASMLTLRGRLTFLEGLKLVAEVEVLETKLEWRPAAQVVVVFEDGTRVDATVDDSKTTAFGFLSNGQLARLVLKLKTKGPACRPERLEITNGGASALLELQ